MAFYDWNKDGKKDWQDDFIEYNIYKDSTGETNNSYGRSSGGGMSTLGAIVVTVGILLVLGLILQAFEPKCAHSGCDNKPAEGSSYCWLHKSRSYTTYSTTRSSTNSSSTSNTSPSSSGNYKSSTETSKSSGTTSQSGSNSVSSSSKKTYHDTYDDGYDDIYMDEDYDQDRYDKDSDYASGVDDAMDDMDEDW